MAIIEYRDHSAGEWKKSAMNWSLLDIQFFNRLCGYIKYRARGV